MQKFRLWCTQASEYISMFLWLMRDIAVQFRWRSLRIVAAGAGNLASKYAAMGMLYVFVQVFEQEGPLTIQGVTLPSADSPVLLVLGIVGVLVFMISAAALNYDANSQAIWVGRNYEEFCSKRILMLVGWLPHPQAERANRDLASGEAKNCVGDGRMLGRIARQMGSAIPAVAGFLVGSVILIWIDHELTAIIVVLALLAFAAQYPANRRAVRISRVLEDNLRPAGRRMKDILARLSSSPLPLTMDSPILERTFEDEHVRTSIDYVSNRRRTVVEVTLVSQIGGSVILAIMLLVLGGDILEGNRTWGEAVVYVGALRFTLRDFVGTSGVFIQINRRLTQIERYIGFVRSAAKAVDGSCGVATVKFEELNFNVPALPEYSAGSLHAPAGAVLAVMTAAGADYTVSAALLEAVEEKQREGLRSPAFMDTALIDPGVPLRASLALPASLQGDAVKADLMAFAPEGEALDWADDNWLDKEPDTPWNDVLPDWAVYALQALAAIAHGHQLLLVNGTALGQLGDDWLAALKAKAPDAVVILNRRRVNNLGAFGETAVIFCDSEAARAWAPIDGSLENKAALEAAHERISSAAGAPNGDFDDFEDDDEFM